jgi:CheY-like chemotaxis protein
MANVLIVDDNENNRLLLRTILKYAGYAVVETARALEAFQLAGELLPDIIVVDLSLPDVSGPELIRRLRANPRTADLTILLYTATERTPMLDDLMEIYGIAGLIPKPGDPREILEAFTQITG